MKQEIIDVIKKYIEVDEKEIDVRLTNQSNEDGTNGAPALYANIPILNIRNDAKGEKMRDQEEENSEKKEESKEVKSEQTKKKGRPKKEESKEVEVKEETERKEDKTSEQEEKIEETEDLEKKDESEKLAE